MRPVEALVEPPTSRVARVASYFRKVRGVPVHNIPSAPVWDGSRPLRVVSWNVQYCAGIEQHFFYDGGQVGAAPLCGVAAWTALIRAHA